ncbi:MAG: patatin-like phospholipase family protein [Woeseiaceae bacterium]|nr:patatin-like phospholipase family protein [Woeseiaceae bacterium]
MAAALSFRAGPGAIAEIRKHGFSPAQIGTMAGASGGAKWLVLSKLDRVVASTIIPRLEGPVYLIGTSIGSWRFACYAQDDPLGAIARFEEAYLGQSYTDDPDRDEITAKSHEILDYVLGPGGTSEILSHPVFRTNVMTVRSRHITATEHPAFLGFGLMLAATLNAVSRSTLGAFFERVLFYDQRDLPPFFNARGFPMTRVELNQNNLRDSIVATGSIPMVMSGVRDIAGAPKGMYRDGGVIDYHLDLPHSESDRLTLYLHFIDRIVPGWFDKQLSWRKPQPAHIDRTILVSPSQDFVERLPYAKIPDRRDFLNFSPAERIRAWRTTVDMCDELADEFHELIDKDQLAARLEPL